VLFLDEFTESAATRSMVCVSRSRTGVVVTRMVGSVVFPARFIANATFTFNPTRRLVSASDGPRGGHAAVYRGGLTDGRFERCTDGLPAWFDDNIDTYCLDSLNDGSFAAFGTADGRLFCSQDRGRLWRELSVGLPAVQHVLVAPD
jgi:hypothetical protein